MGNNIATIRTNFLNGPYKVFLFHSFHQNLRIFQVLYIKFWVKKYIKTLLRKASYLKVFGSHIISKTHIIKVYIQSFFKREAGWCDGSCGWPCLGDPMKGLGLLQEVSVWVTGYFHVCFFQLIPSGKASCVLQEHTPTPPTAQFPDLNQVSWSVGRFKVDLILRCPRMQ